MAKRDSKKLKAQMSGHWLSAFSVLAPSLSPAIEKLGQSVACPHQGGEDGFRLFLDANETGGGVKHSDRAFPEGIDLLMWVNDWTFVQAFDELDAYLNGSATTTPDVRLSMPKPVVPVCTKQLRSWLNTIWQQALPMSHPDSKPAITYFGNRGLDNVCLKASDLRFHKSLNYRDKKRNLLGTFGCILSLVRNNQGNPVLIHRTFLDENGDKVDFGKRLGARKMTPPVDKRVKGRQIRLFKPEHGYLGICEGIETAMTIKSKTGLAVWPCLSASMLKSFQAPEGIHTVVNFVDKDRKQAGELAAKGLRDQWSSGTQLIDLLPPTPILDSDPKGVDWHDQFHRDPSAFSMVDELLCR